MNGKPLGALALAVLIGGGFAYGFLSRSPADTGMTTTRPSAAEKGTPIVAVETVSLEGDESLGETAFNAKCAACHGENAAGRNGIAPPLVHKIYEPGHHGDQAFFLAAQNGVRSHHWPFGDMPPVPGLTRSDIANIVAYVRALQRANGIN